MKFVTFHLHVDATERATEHKLYHKVDARSLYKGRVSKRLCVEELNLRMEFAKKYYRGRVDKRHKHWMNKLYTNVSKDQHIKLALTLDTLAEMNKCKK